MNGFISRRLAAGLVVAYSGVAALPATAMAAPPLDVPVAVPPTLSQVVEGLLDAPTDLLPPPDGAEAPAGPSQGAAGDSTGNGTADPADGTRRDSSGLGPAVPPTESAAPERAADDATDVAGRRLRARRDSRSESRSALNAARAADAANRASSPASPIDTGRPVGGAADTDGPLPDPLAAAIESIPESVKAALMFMAVILVLLLFGVLVSRRQLKDALRRAHSDVVTGLPNRAAVDETLRRMAGHAARNGTPLGTVMVDLDHFKSLNDVFGHTKGDEVLAAVGAMARAQVRAGDFVGRFGGEELLLLMPDTDEAGAQEVAEKLRRAFSEIEIPAVDRTVTASFGVAAGRGDEQQLYDLVPAADAALYRAKANGRDRVEIASQAPLSPVAA